MQKKKKNSLEFLQDRERNLVVLMGVKLAPLKSRLSLKSQTRVKAADLLQ